MECFIKKIFRDEVDEDVHTKFVRFSKGIYKKRAVLSLQKSSKVKVKGSFEYANDFVLLVADLQNINFSGTILSKEHLDLEEEKKKSGVYSYNIEINSEKIKDLKDRVYYFLLDVNTEEIKLKIKKKLPKPGKSEEGKVDDSFCVLEADLKFWSKIKETFFWDVPDCKKCKIEHMYEIKELIMPEREKDFEKIRLLSKRKGKIIRKLEIDKREQIKEKEFEV